MPDYSDHLNQAKKNLEFLETINTIPEYWDWKVTICFYATVHLVNAHIIKTANLHYRTHSEVENALNFANSMSPASVPQDIFLSYRKLKGLSRRSRYLVNDSEVNKDINTHFTFDRHYSKAIHHLNIVMCYIKEKYGVDFKPYKVKCLEIKQDNTFFKVCK